MKYGNCLTGAIYGMFKLRTLKIRVIVPPRHNWYYPHFYVIDKLGTPWHWAWSGRSCGIRIINMYWFKGEFKPMSNSAKEFFNIKGHEK